MASAHCKALRHVNAIELSQVANSSIPATQDEDLRSCGEPVVYACVVECQFLPRRQFSGPARIILELPLRNGASIKWHCHEATMPGRGTLPMSTNLHPSKVLSASLPTNFDFADC